MYPRQSVIIFSPHPDDDVIGCGGTIAKHVKNSHSVVIVFMTDGRYSLAYHAILKPPPSSLAKLRRYEAIESSRILGVDESRLIFLRYEDMSLTYNVLSAFGQTKKILAENMPDVVYLPAGDDEHIDHMVSNCLIQAASRDMACTVSLREYSVWSEVKQPSLVVDIQDVYELKKRAILQHRSQLGTARALMAKTLSKREECFQPVQSPKTITADQRVRQLGHGKWDLLPDGASSRGALLNNGLVEPLVFVNHGFKGKETLYSLPRSSAHLKTQRAIL